MQLFMSIQVSAATDRPARRINCLTATVLNLDVDGQCDKLVTDDRHQFITLTVRLVDTALCQLGGRSRYLTQYA